MAEDGGLSRGRAARDLLDYLQASPLSEVRALERIVLMLRIADALGETDHLRRWLEEAG